VQLTGAVQFWCGQTVRLVRFSLGAVKWCGLGIDQLGKISELKYTTDSSRTVYLPIERLQLRTKN
jgi:hypothetical protein